ncbi:MAG: glycosyltransferase [Spirochaetaceae bacterium]|nr:glycosyltransferase [Spirochaetaceae bacterium]
MVKISLIVPFYNVAPYFAECLESIVNQSLKEIEIILIDDCGSDGSLAIAQSYVAKDERIKIVKQPQGGGAGLARNKGISEACGNYIWFVDSDDYITSPTACEELYNIAEEQTCEVVRFNGFIFNDSRPQNRANFRPCRKAGLYNTKDYLQTNSYTVSPWLFLFKASFLKNNHLNFAATVQEDIIIALWLLLTVKIYVYSNYFYAYRVRAGSVTTLAVSRQLYEQAPILCAGLKHFATTQLSTNFLPYLIFGYLHVLFLSSKFRQAFKQSPVQANVVSHWLPYLTEIAANFDNKVIKLLKNNVGLTFLSISCLKLLLKAVKKQAKPGKLVIYIKLLYLTVFIDKLRPALIIAKLKVKNKK